MSARASGPRLGVDVGGTFTDVALERPDGTFTSLKVLTTHQQPEEAIIAGVTALTRRESVDIADIAQIIPRDHAGHQRPDRTPRSPHRAGHHRRVSVM